MNCTAATELTRHLLAVDIAELGRATADIPPGANGILTLPFFNGERSPDLPHGKGCIFGLDSSNYSPGNLLRSAMEAAVYGLRGGLDALRSQGCAIDSVRLTGGGAASAVWRQMVADVFDIPVTVQTVDDGAALGAALQALWLWEGSEGDKQALQQMVDTHLTIDVERGCAPRTDSAQRYNDYYHHYLRHIEAVRHLYT
jgi:xylulokinase